MASSVNLAAFAVICFVLHGASAFTSTQDFRPRPARPVRSVRATRTARSPNPLYEHTECMRNATFNPAVSRIPYFPFHLQCPSSQRLLLVREYIGVPARPAQDFCDKPRVTVGDCGAEEGGGMVGECAGRTRCEVYIPAALVLFHTLTCPEDRELYVGVMYRCVAGEDNTTLVTAPRSGQVTFPVNTTAPSTVYWYYGPLSNTSTVAYFEESVVKAGDRQWKGRTHLDPKTAALTLTNLTKEDAGHYCCVSTPKGSTLSIRHYYNLTVSDALVAAFFTKEEIGKLQPGVIEQQTDFPDIVINSDTDEDTEDYHADIITGLCMIGILVVVGMIGVATYVYKRYIKVEDPEELDITNREIPSMVTGLRTTGYLPRI